MRIRPVYRQRRLRPRLSLKSGAISRENGLRVLVPNAPSIKKPKVAAAIIFKRDRYIPAQRISGFVSNPPCLQRAEMAVFFICNRGRVGGLIGFATHRPSLLPTKIAFAFSLNASAIFRENGICGFASGQPRLSRANIAAALIFKRDRYGQRKWTNWIRRDSA